MKAPANPRSITPEEHLWLDVWSLELQHQLTKAVAERHSMSIALGMAGYLTARYAGEPAAIVEDQTKARYRKILRELAADGIYPGPGKSEIARSPQPPIMFAISESADERLRPLEYSGGRLAFGLVGVGASAAGETCSTRVVEVGFRRVGHVLRAA